MANLIDLTQQSMGWDNPWQTREASQLTHIGVHHSATEDGDQFTFEIHWKSLGWTNGGYSEIVLRNGDVQICYVPEVVTNGIAGHNITTYHICVVGDGTTGAFTPEQEKSLEARIRYNQDRFNIPVDHVMGHNEFSNTATLCPGRDMNALRNQLAQPESDGLIFSFNRNQQTATLIGYTGSSRHVVIPPNVNDEGTDYTVTSIGQNAFGFNQLDRVEIPATVTLISSNAFSDNRLTTIHIPNSVITIGQNAFGFNNLTNVNIPESVNHIDDFAFVGNSLERIRVSSSTITIGYEPFRHNPLRYIDVPSGAADAMRHMFTPNVMGGRSISEAIIREDPKYQWDGYNTWVPYELKTNLKTCTCCSS